MLNMHSLAALLSLSFAICTDASILTHREDGNSTNVNSPASNSTSTRSLTSTRLLTVSPPNATASGNASLSDTGTGLEYASSCNDAKISWVFAKTSSTYISTQAGAETSYINHFTTQTALPPGATPFTLCDGYPRLNGTTSFETSTETKLIPYTTVLTVSTTMYKNYTRPSCSIQPSDCSQLNSSYYSLYTPYESWYDASLSALNNNGPFTTPAPPSPSEKTAPICGTPTRPPLYMTLPPAACAQAQASITLLYWLVETTSGCDLCSLDGCPTKTMEPTITGAPNTVVTLGTTLTSPTVYFAFQGNWDYLKDGTTLKNRTDLVFPQAATAVSSYCYTGGDAMSRSPPQSFNYANLNGPVPADAYRCQQKCWQTTSAGTSIFTTSGTVTSFQYYDHDWLTENRCSTIWDDYDPVLSVPAELSSLSLSVATFDGALTCQFTIAPGAYLFDPPIALTKQTAAAGATLPASNPAEPTSAGSSPSVEPANSPPKNTVQPTAQPDQTPEGNTPAAQPQQSNNGATLPNPQPSANDPAPSPSSGGDDPKASPQAAQSTQNIGGIIASAIGATQGAGNTAAPALNSPASPAAASPVPGAIITGSNGQQVPVINSVGSQIIVGSATLQPGASTNVAGIGTVVAGSSGVVINGQTQAFSQIQAAAPSPGLIVGGQTFTANSASGFSVGGQTLTPGGQITVDGTTISLSKSGSTPLAVVNGETQTLSAGPEAASNGALKIDGHMVTANSAGDYVIAPGETLTPGGVLTVSGSTISLAPSDGIAVINGVTQTLTPTSASADARQLILGSETITENAVSAFVIAPGETLTPGGVLTVSGTTISEDPSGGFVVVTGVTQTLRSSASEMSTTASDGSSSTGTGSATRSSGTQAAPSAATNSRSAASSIDCRWSMMVGMSLSIVALLTVM